MVQDINGNDVHEIRYPENEGMSLRAWLSAMAMQSLLLKHSQHRDDIANEAVRQADSMIAAMKAIK